MTMTDEALDQQPGAAGPETATGTDQAPAAIPAPHVAEQADDGDLDLLDLDADPGDGEGEDAADTSAAQPPEDAERPAWQRPEGLKGDDLVDWKLEQGLPTDVTGYEVKLDLAEGQTITETGQLLIDGLKTFAVEHDLSPPAVNGLAKWYDAQVKAQQAKLAESDKALRTETQATLTEKWRGSYEPRMEVAREGARLLPQPLRAMLRVARTPDGRRIAHTSEFAEAMLAIGRLRTGKGASVQTSDEERLAEIASVRTANIDDYYAKGLDKEALEVGRRIAAKGQPAPVALSPADAQEERELVQLLSEDVDSYRYRQWRGSGKTGSERLLEIRRKREGTAV